jgi:hypothetical protein
MIGVDIDGTIATMVSATGFRPIVDYYKGLAIGVSASVSDYESLLIDPAFMLYYQNNTEIFNETVKNILESPETILRKDPISGAVAGINRLAALDNIQYCTVRKSDQEQRQQGIQEATKEWLFRHRFPHAESVTFCKSVMNKLVRIYQQEKDSQEPLVLIDDRWKVALEAFDELIVRNWNVITDLLRERLVLVAFGVSKIPEVTNGLQVVPLLSWSNLDEIYPLLSSRKQSKHASNSEYSDRGS